MPRFRAYAAAGLATLLHSSGKLWAASGDSTSSAAVFGVSPADQAKYRPIHRPDETPKFRCLSSVAAGGEEHAVAAESGITSEFPYSVVNDNFCDCPDGSDEPGTAACAGQHHTLFFCPNERSEPRYVYTSRVGDGVCDCCDGSDESKFRTPCSNTCEEEGRSLRRKRQQSESERHRGVKKRQDAIKKGRKVFDAARLEKEKLERARPRLEEKERSALAALEVARKIWLEITQNASAVNASNSTDEGDKPSGTVTTDSAPEPDASETAASESKGKEEQPAISEYTKWMEGAESVIAEEEKATPDADAPKAAPAPAPEEAKKEKDLKYSCGRGKRNVSDCMFCSDGKWDDAAKERTCRGDCKWNTLRRACELKVERGFFRAIAFYLSEALDIWLQRIWPRWKSPEERAVQNAADDLAEAKVAISENKRRLEELDKLLESDSDDLLAYRGLDGTCLKSKAHEFNYEICFFKKATQDSRNIGHWRGWEGPDEATFADGQPCPGGIKRSLKVTFECGPKDEIAGVEETSKCAYEATVLHFGACRESEFSNETRPRMPTDEL